MRYVEDEVTGRVQLTLTEHEAQRLEDFLHLAAMSLQTWPRCVDRYMTERKSQREAQGSIEKREAFEAHH